MVVTKSSGNSVSIVVVVGVGVCIVVVVGVGIDVGGCIGRAKLQTHSYSAGTCIGSPLT